MRGIIFTASNIMSIPPVRALGLMVRFHKKKQCKPQ
jgi:hypothetical protein